MTIVKKFRVGPWRALVVRLDGGRRRIRVDAGGARWFWAERAAGGLVAAGGWPDTRARQAAELAAEWIDKRERAEAAGGPVGCGSAEWDKERAAARRAARKEK